VPTAGAPVALRCYHSPTSVWFKAPPAPAVGAAAGNRSVGGGGVGWGGGSTAGEHGVGTTRRTRRVLHMWGLVLQLGCTACVCVALPRCMPRSSSASDGSPALKHRRVAVQESSGGAGDCPGGEGAEGPSPAVPAVKGVPPAGVTADGDHDSDDDDDDSLPDYCTCGLHGVSNWQRLSLLNDEGAMELLAGAVDAALSAAVHAQEVGLPSHPPPPHSTLPHAHTRFRMQGAPVPLRLLVASFGEGRLSLAAARAVAACVRASVYGCGRCRSNSCRRERRATPPRPHARLPTPTPILCCVAGCGRGAAVHHRAGCQRRRPVCAAGLHWGCGGGDGGGSGGGGAAARAHASPGSCVAALTRCTAACGGRPLC
jgi:hypothetical protein